MKNFILILACTFFLVSCGKNDSHNHEGHDHGDHKEHNHDDHTGHDHGDHKEHNHGPEEVLDDQEPAK